MSDSVNNYRLIPPATDYSSMLNYNSMPNPYMNGNTGMSYWGMPSPFAFTGNQGTQSSVQQAGTATPSNPQTIQNQKAQAEKELQELYAARAQLADVVEVETSPGVTQMVSREAYSEKTGYIAEDGRNDGEISGWKKCLNFLKGCTNLVTDMFFDEKGHFSLKKTATTLVIGGALAAAAFLIPGAGVVLAGAAVASGALTLGTGIVQTQTAKTDEAAEKAWQNIGSGSLQTILSVVGLKSIGKTSAAKLGAEAPKWYRPDQAVKLGLKAAKSDINAAGGMTKAIAQNYNKMKVGFDKFTAKKWGYSHYEKKYTNNLNKLKTDIPGAGTEYRQYADDIAAAYEKVYSAQSNAEYTQAVNELQRLSNAARAYKNSNVGLSDEAIAAFDDMIKISESVAPRNAYAIRTSKFGTSGYTAKMADLDAKINELRALGNAATPEQKYQLRILTRTKAANRALYQANSPEKQKRAVEMFEQISNEALTKMQEVRRNPGTTSEVMKSYNDIATLAQEQASKVNMVIEARAADLTRAAKILDDKMATNVDKAKARVLINKYLTNTPADDEAYISSVDKIISILKLEKKPEPCMQKIQNWKSGKIQNGKNCISRVWSYTNQPSVYMTSTFNRAVYPQSIFSEFPLPPAYGIKVENSEIDAQLKQINEQINQLQSQLY